MSALPYCSTHLPTNEFAIFSAMLLKPQHLFHSVNFAVLKFLTLTEDHQEGHQEDNKSCILCKSPNYWETVDEQHR